MPGRRKLPASRMRDGSFALNRSSSDHPKENIGQQGAIPFGPELPDKSRQISGTGPYYRGPGAPASGPMHHYVFELFALDAMLDVPAVGASPPQTRAVVMAAMAGHVRGKAAYVGVFKRM